MKNDKTATQKIFITGLIIAATIQSAFAKRADFSPYISLSGGYGIFDNAVKDTGQTGFGRIGCGLRYAVLQKTQLGAEIGLQSGTRMEVTGNPASAFGYFALPVYVTIKPPIDMLFIAQQDFASSIFIQVKAGAVFLNTLIDNADISNASRFRAEAQAEIGFHLSKKSSIALTYQHFFGQTLTLTHINVNQGTASLSQVPSWHAAMLTYEVIL